MSATSLSRLFAALALFLLIGVVIAKEEQVETVATGTGDDETAALSDALAKAVAQVLGVQSELNVATGRQNVRGRTVTEEGGATAETRFEVSAGQTANATMRAKGRVARYEVESVETLPDGRVRVTARAWVVKHTPEVYKAPGSAPSKRRVAVLPVSTDRYEYDFFGKVGGNELGDRLTNAIESALISSGSVSVMDRRSLDVALSELGLLGSNFAAPAERAKLRNLRGTDLVVQVTLREAVQEQYTEVFKTTGQTKVHNSVRLEGEIRGIVPATSEVVFNRVVSVYGGASRQAAFDEFAAQVAAEAIGAVTGKPPARAPQPTRTVASAEEPPPPPEPEGPRRSGVRLKFDRR
ncbi:MAG: hypothetical protein KatS3mg125_2113 [Lysobacterales bacterium]|jgi:hypothetical protein|nr:MAG: hypothetical protein KatS3mg125_2113 [Xanthomonadales bacterium]